MRITICGSIIFTNEIKKIKDKLEKQGHQVNIPFTSEKILNEELTLEEYKREKEKGEDVKRKIDDNVIKRYYDLIKDSDAILVVNITKNNIKNYIGGNTFLEIGFAHVLNKKIYLFHDIPQVSYSDEIEAMRPIVINSNLKLIK